MCGILVLKADRISSDLENKFMSSLNSLKSRGPDETRVIKRKKYLIGFTRLSINNISNGSQPFISNCKRYILVFNGEIVNFKILINQFKNSIEFKLKSEAEVIFNLYKLFGKDCVNYLRGFFAFAIIDLKLNNIFCAVDRFAIKPLYFHENEKYSLFISDYTPLIKNRLISDNLNMEKISDYFTFAREFDDKTIFKGVKKLSAGTYLNYDKNKKKKFVKYWNSFKKDEIKLISENYLVEEFNNKLLETIKLWETAETQMSLSLSSGMDSNIIKLFLDLSKSKYQGFHLNERKGFDTDQRNIKSIKLNYKEIKVLLNKLIKNSLTPFAFSHSSSTSLLQLYSHISNKNFKFTLNGEGADEMFGGYSRYKKLLYLTKNKKMSLSDSYINLYKKEIKCFNENLKYKYKNLNKKLKNKIKKINFSSKNIENQLLEFDQLTWIPSLIQRHDIIGMAYGLEVRPPFLDHELVQKANSLPLGFKYNYSYNKIMLNKILQKNKRKIHYQSYKKLPTPTVFNEILKDKNEIKEFKEKLFYGKLSYIFNVEKIFKNFFDGETNHIFLCRLYILKKMIN